MKMTLLLLFISISSQAGPFITITNKKELIDYIQKSQFNGVVLVAKDQNVILRKAFGKRDFIDNVDLKETDIFQIGSLTKQFVAASVLKLQEDKKLSINNYVTKYLPELTNYSNAKVIDFLNHSAGIKNYTDTQDFWDKFLKDKNFVLNDIYSFVAALPAEFKPREKYQYSNSGYIVVAKIIENLTNKPWLQYLNVEFIEKLNMQNTFANINFSDVSDVKGHVFVDNSYIQFNEFNTSWAQAAGMLQSNVDDLLKWTSIYANSQLLSEDSKTLMQTPFKNNYALGITSARYENDTLISHGGRVPGFVSNLSYLKSHKLSVITLDNIDGQISVKDVLLDYYFDNSAEALKTEEVLVSDDVLNNYVGTYTIEKSKLEFGVYVENRHLYLKPNDDQPAYKLKAVDVDSFTLLTIAGEEFIRDENNKVVSLKHYQGGHVSIFKKAN